MMLRPEFRSKTFVFGITVLAAAAALTGCAVDDDALDPSNGATEQPQTTELALLPQDNELAALVPDELADKTLLYSTSENPPYFMVKSDGSFEGLGVDLMEQAASILGLDIEMQSTTLDATIPGIQSGRIDISGPAGDFTERQEQVDFADVAKSNVTLLVKSGAGFEPSSNLDLCGTDLGIKKGAGTQTVLDNVSAQCADAGEKPVNISTYADLAQANLAVQSGRIAAVVAPTAPNSLAAAESAADFEVITIDDMQSLPAATAVYGFETAKGNGLSEALVGALQLMHDEGVYDALFEKWGISASVITQEQLVKNGSTQSQKG